MPAVHSDRLHASIAQIKNYAIFSTDLAGIISTWNEGCKHVLGYDEAEFIGLDSARLFPPDAAAMRAAEAELQAAAKDGVAGSDRWMVRRSGDKFWAAGTTTALHDPTGNLVGFAKVICDNTEQRQVDEQLHATVRRLQLLSDAARNLLETKNPLELLDRSFDGLSAEFGLDYYFHFTIEPNAPGLRLRASRGVSAEAVREIERLDAGEAVCSRVAQLLEPIVIDDVQESREPLTGFIRGLGITAYACLPLIAHGTLLGTLSFGTRRHRTFTPELIGIARALTDMISEAIARHQAAHALTASAAKFRLVVEAAPNGMVMVDENGVITMANAQMERLFGYERAEMIGQRIEMLLPGRYRARHPEQRQQFFESPQARAMGHGRDLFGRRKDGTEFPVEVGLNPAETPEGRVVLAAVIDITERKRTEAALATAHGELADYARKLETAVTDRTAHLEQTIAELEGVSYSLSHDMRAPLRTIMGFSQIVLADAGDRLGDQQKELLKRTINAANRLDRLIQDVLTYTRVSRQSVALTTVDVERLLRQIIDERPELQAPNAEIVIEGPLAAVRGHEASLTQCITNLLDNAVKFVRAGQRPITRIRSETTKDGWVRLWFEDNGIGIPREAQTRLFGIFQRVHDDRMYPGTGIGLAIVRKAVERMGGTVWVESELGKGSRFCVQLPRGHNP